ncbi:MAG: hypothetical protein R3E10_18665 [Gemmatimonadota bacterium]
MDESLRVSVRLESDQEDAEVAESNLRDLLFELRAQDVESAELEQAAGPPGTKGADLAALIVETAPALLSIVAALIHKKLKHTPATVKFEGRVGGQRVKFEGAPDAFATLLTTLGGAATDG